MRSLPPSRGRRARLAAGMVLAGGLALAPAVTASAATPSATPTPGMGSRYACPPSVYYSITGKPPTPRPLPAPASSVGGDRLAAGGLQVTDGATTPPPAPRATAWIVADLGTGRVLASCNAHVPLAPASSLKLLTALALAPRIEPAATYRARAEDAAVDGTKVGLVPGSAYTASDLWHALLMSSANDAATGLAAMAGGTEAATTAMHETAARLGARDTVVRNTSGLDEQGQVSSAYDLAVFGRAALRNPTITTYAQTRSYTFPGPGAQVGAPGRKTFQIQNHDRLLYNYPGALGLKNGWTSTTGGSFVGAAERDGRRLVVSVLAADPPTWHMTAALLDWGFTATNADAPGVGRLVDRPETGNGAADGAGSAPGAPDVASGAAGAPSSERFGVGEAFALVVGAGALAAAGGLGARNYRTSRRPRSSAATDPDQVWRRRRSW